MQLQDFRAELQQRGFDGFAPTDINRYVNFGYRTIARLTKWSWEESVVTKSVAVGSYRFSFVTDLPTLKSVKAVNVTTVGFESRLRAISEDTFYNQYAAYDLTNVQNRGEPDSYYADSAYLYVLPPPASVRAISITGETELVDLVDNVDPIVPPEYEEAIMYAAEEVCHLRARQPQFADNARKKLEEFFDDALADESGIMQDLQERVVAGRQWL